VSVFVITSGKLPPGVLARTLVIHSGTDQRFDHHTTEGE
jgi:hypothetical protein